MAWVWEGEDKFKLVLAARSLVIPDGAREPRRSGTLFQVCTRNEVPGLALARPG